MNTNQERVSEVARDWTDVVGDWLFGLVHQGFSGLEGVMSPETVVNLSKAVSTFIFIFTELTILFLLISFIIGLLQSYIPPEKIQKMLSRKRGYFMAALMGAITPFCSCSTIPFLKGLIRAGAGFGGIIIFLLASPLLNPIIIGLFFISFGLKVAVYYFTVAMLFSIVAGIVLERLGFEKYVRPLDTPDPVACACGSGEPEPTGFRHFSSIAWKQAQTDFKQAFWFMFGGVVIGAMIYGFVPAEFISTHAGGESPFAVPFAAVIGVPLYIRAEAVIPISLGLVQKGMSLGAVMAFIIGSAGASLTEVVMLKALFRKQIIAMFLVVVFSMAIFAGYLLPVIL